ncbi:MAG: hypothetical protein GXC76_13110 [Rhodanobacteraceae bacterium]|jgi:hypothetical protein|nr:hypothetical protein [Rhodanobacteraceae bacterium]
MRLLALSALIATALCACSPSTPEAPVSSATTPAPTAAPAPAAEAKPAEAAPAVAKEIPEGACGDQSALPADQRVANTARWTTASEQDNFGFDVFRSDSEHGEFAKLNKEPILGAGTSDETHKYEYRDDTIDPCHEYWYYVEGISTNGHREKFTPTFRAPPKRRAVGSAAPATTPAAEPGVPAQE